MARLSESEWDQLKADWCTDHYSNRELGERYGVSNVAITKRVKNEGWGKNKNSLSDNSKSTACGFIYVLKITDTANNVFYKIGLAKNLEQRVNTLQTGNPFEIKIILSFYVESMIEEEKKLHFMFSHKRLRGEWFNLTNDDLNIIASMVIRNG